MENTTNDELELLDYLDKLRRLKVPKVNTVWGKRERQRIASAVYQLSLDEPKKDDSILGPENV